jgi:hypothetical protein
MAAARIELGANLFHFAALNSLFLYRTRVIAGNVDRRTRLCSGVGTTEPHG